MYIRHILFPSVAPFHTLYTLSIPVNCLLWKPVSIKQNAEVEFRFQRFLQRHIVGDKLPRMHLPITWAVPFFYSQGHGCRATTTATAITLPRLAVRSRATATATITAIPTGATTTRTRTRRRTTMMGTGGQSILLKAESEAKRHREGSVEQWKCGVS